MSVEPIFIILLVIISALFLLMARPVRTGGAAGTNKSTMGTNKSTMGTKKLTAVTKKPTALMVNCGYYHYWPLRDKLSRAGFKFDPDSINGIYIQSPIGPLKHNQADFIRLDRHYVTNTLDYRFLNVKSAFINRFDRISKRAFVVKHIVHKFLADKHFYPTCVALTRPPMDRVWIARPSSTEYTPGITTWSGVDIKIIYDEKSLRQAQELYASRARSVKELTPNNEYSVSVTEYITNPLLHDGKKTALMMYMISGSGETVEPFCSINKDIGFYRIAADPYVADSYDNMDIHYAKMFLRGIFYPQNIPADKLISVRSQLCDIEAALCPLAMTLAWPEAARGAYEIFTLELLIDQNYHVWLTGISPVMAYPLAEFDDPSLEVFYESFARWEYDTAIEPLTRGLLMN